MDKQILLKNLDDSNGERLENYAIVSGNHYTFESAINEVMNRAHGSKLLKWLSPISALIYLPQGYVHLLDAIKTNPPVFLQHISPVQYALTISEYKNISLELSDFIKKHISKDISSHPFSVQTTAFSNEDSTVYEINKAVSDALVELGRELNVKNPDQIISIGIDSNILYLGLSNAKDNLSKWSCGIAHYSKDVNRAENKLLECIDYFDLNISRGNALDIGAAPGGWTKVLANLGHKVWAVDPAILNDDVTAIGNVTHVKTTAQKFLSSNTIAFDMIVNDMVMDCRESANIMNLASQCLLKSGHAIITAKLPKQGYNKRLKTAIRILSQEYNIIGARQLPSNKSEVTILLSKITK